MTPSAFLFFWWPLRCVPEQNNLWIIFIYFLGGLCFDWCKSRRRRRVIEGRRRDSPPEEVKAREVMREMEFAGSVWDRSASWSCKCVFCLHACACRDCIPAIFGSLRGTKRVNLHVTIIPGSFPVLHQRTGIFYDRKWTGSPGGMPSP